MKHPLSTATLLHSNRARALLALAFAVGHFAPWAAHHTAALTLNAHELAIFTNLTPGAGVFWNEWFLLPLLASAVLWSLATAPHSRWLAAAPGLGIASLGLPPYPGILTLLDSPEERLRFGLTLFTLGWVIVNVALGARMTARARAIGAAASCVAATLPLVGYLIVRPFIEALYGSAVGVGWGWWTTALAVVIGIFSHLRAACSDAVPQSMHHFGAHPHEPSGYT